MVHAQMVFRVVEAELAASGVGLVFIGVILHVATQVFEDFGVEDRRADFVDSHGPLAEVDLAAAVTTEGKVLVCAADQHSAGGAAEKFGGFFSGGHRSYS
jgi:hypothetical protein